MASPVGKQQIVSDLIAYFSAMLRVPAGQIRSDAHVLELGADSIMLVEAQRWLSERFDCSIEMRRFFDDLETIESIADFIVASSLDAHEARGVEPPTLSIGATSPETGSLDLPAAPTGVVDFDLMHAQLTLVAETIEAQNRLLGRAGGRPGEPRRPAATHERA